MKTWFPYLVVAASLSFIFFMSLHGFGFADQDDNENSYSASNNAIESNNEITNSGTKNPIVPNTTSQLHNGSNCGTDPDGNSPVAQCADEPEAAKPVGPTISEQIDTYLAAIKDGTASSKDKSAFSFSVSQSSAFASIVLKRYLASEGDKVAERKFESALSFAALPEASIKELFDIALNPDSSDYQFRIVINELRRLWLPEDEQVAAYLSGVARVADTGLFDSSNSKNENRLEEVCIEGLNLAVCRGSCVLGG